MSRIETIRHKIVDQAHLDSRLFQHRLKGRKIVFTNGVFDILHKGHVTLLNQASEFGDILVLGLNSDASVKMLNKGPERPINPEQDRALVLASLQCVDLVVIFSESTPLELIRRIKPDVLVKGGDYDPACTDRASKEYIVGSDLQRKAGRAVVSIPLVEGYSTTRIVRKLENG